MNRPTGTRNGLLITFDAETLTAWRDELLQRIAAYEEAHTNIDVWRADLREVQWVLGDG